MKHEPLTLLFKPFSDSDNHFKNSWDGETGKSSILPPAGDGDDLEADGWVIERTVGVLFGRVVDDEAAPTITDGRGGTAKIGFVFPFEPTVTHALLVVAVADGTIL